MNNEIRNIFGDDIDNSIIECMVECLDKMNLTPEQIAEYIGEASELIRELIYLKASLDGKKELADKISKANEFIKLKRNDEFKKSVANGTHEDFLANMTWTDKCSLLVGMGLFRIGIPSEKPLTEEEQRYCEIIDNSIQKDMEKEALSQGFDSVEDWRTHNAMENEALREALRQGFDSVEDWKTHNAMHRMGIETQSGVNILLYEKDDYKR